MEELPTVFVLDVEIRHLQKLHQKKSEGEESVRELNCLVDHGNNPCNCNLQYTDSLDKASLDSRLKEIQSLTAKLAVATKLIDDLDYVFTNIGHPSLKKIYAEFAPRCKEALTKIREEA